VLISKYSKVGSLRIEFTSLGLRVRSITSPYWGFRFCCRPFQKCGHEKRLNCLGGDTQAFRRKRSLEQRRVSQSRRGYAGASFQIRRTSHGQGRWKNVPSCICSSRLGLNF